MLTVRQKEVLVFIREYLRQQGSPPTRAEIARALGFRSVNAAESHVRALAKKGAIRLTPGTARGIQLLEEGLPVIGRVAAGRPILASIHIERRITVAAGLFHPEADYLLRVQGSSMINAGILDGDLLAVHKTQTARHGQIVVARLDDEVTVKRLYRRDGRVLLNSENEAFAPIQIDQQRHEFAIEGVGVGVLRTNFP